MSIETQKQPVYSIGEFAAVARRVGNGIRIEPCISPQGEICTYFKPDSASICTNKEGDRIGVLTGPYGLECPIQKGLLTIPESKIWQKAKNLVTLFM